MTRWTQNPMENIISSMARELGEVPPCFLARILVKAFCQSLVETSAKMAVSCDLDGLDNPPTQPTPKSRVFNHTKMYRDPSSIPHKGMSSNVAHCHVVDPHYSPAMDEFRNRIGREYEDRLSAYLSALNVGYLDEPGMRRMGYARTPDAILLEPIAVDGHVVKWIESKAWFGDPPSHATYLRDQYWPYYNRFGPGMVIYWFGFVEEATEAHHAKGVLVVDGFPDAERITRIESDMMDVVRNARPVEISDEDGSRLNENT
jgi:hypothetical protein